MTKAKVFLGLPGYSSQIHAATARAALTHATDKSRFELDYRFLTGSLLTWVFNRLWAEALNTGATHFAMLHGDIVPPDYWLDRLFDVLTDHEADLAAAVVPIKNTSGATSTAIDDQENPWQPRRLTMKELQRLPDVFAADDVHRLDGWEGPFGGLLANTGCWICDLTRPWVREQDDDSPFLRHSFTQLDGIFKGDDGKYRVSTSPEDWNFSRRLNASFGRVLCVKMPGLLHVGEFGYPANQAWGQDRDENFFLNRQPQDTQ